MIGRYIKVRGYGGKWLVIDKFLTWDTPTVDGTVVSVTALVCVNGEEHILVEYEVIEKIYDISETP